MSNLNDKINFKKSKGCFNCGEEGHFSGDCPNPKKERNDFKKPNECFICGQEGHRKYNCPKFLENKHKRGAIGDNNTYYNNEKYSKKDNNVIKNINFNNEASHNKNTDWSQTNFIEKENYKNADLGNNDTDWNFTSNNNKFNENILSESTWGRESEFSENQKNCDSKIGWI